MEHFTNVYAILDRQFQELEKKLDYYEQKCENSEGELSKRFSDKFWSLHAEWNALEKLERNFIGTDYYTGRAQFNYEYRHYLRSATVSQRKSVHDLWKSLGMELDGKSDEHHETVQTITCQS
jgi:hypothetical protein|tara:strand:- start:165 stop:530 length:366 start_codon:yes stop_codon:yes gene_type:complete